MDQRHRGSAFVARGDHDDPQSSENGAADSPLSGDDSRATTTALSPKKGRRSIQKRVVSVRIGDVEGSRSSSYKGEAYPPSDSWAWRKYGQKPIKGSPYPRGYYRCSSSKGCPARKQVERSRVDPTMLVITYACEHNHPVPTIRHHHHHPSASAAPAAPTSPESLSTPEAAAAAVVEVEDEFLSLSEDQKELLTCAEELGLGDAVLMDFTWLSDVVKEAPLFVGPRWNDADVSVLPVMREEEEESLFADLDELPECSAVFRGISTSNLRPPARNALCSTKG